MRNISTTIKDKIDRSSSQWLVLLIDLFLVSICFILAYTIRYNLTWNFDFSRLLENLPIVILVGFGSFILTGSYKGHIRYTGRKDVYSIFNSICLISMLLIIITLMLDNWTTIGVRKIPLSIIIIHSLLSFIVLVASRLVFVGLYKNITRETGKIMNVMILGAGEFGILTYNALQSSARNIKVIGYLDNEKKKSGRRINGLKVFSIDQIGEDFYKEKEVSEVIVAKQNIDANELRKIVDGFIQADIQVKIIPPVERWINGELKESQIKSIQIEDLLGRPPIILKNPRVNEEFFGKTLFVTGGAGSIGSEIVRQITEYDYNSLIVIDQAESPLYDLQQELLRKGVTNFIPIVADIRDKKRMTELFSQFRPQLVFHAAAYKHVPLMEANPYEAIRINIGGTKNIAHLAMKFDVEKFVFVSTDKAVNPTNVMGATKRAAEMLLGTLKDRAQTKFIITRFGNVLGSNGSVIPLFKRQMEQGGPLTVTHKEVTRYFMTIPEASSLVLEAGCMGSGGEIFVFDMGESIKIFDLAKKMIFLSGFQYPDEIDIQIVGLRPGEKLYEELLATGENTLPTHHDKIMISKSRSVDSDSTYDQIEELLQECEHSVPVDQLKSTLKEIVPEYEAQFVEK